MKKRILVILSISAILFALTYNSFEVLPTQVSEKTVETDTSKTLAPHWEGAIQDLEEAFDLSEEEVTDLHSWFF